ncbi:MAG: 4Fe-4S dicluster domain-containing protein [Lachnospiraceae bacterium]|nr:4Fe-4S dicluster domain-containing protein [Lachnospiraceae bacterium]
MGIMNYAPSALANMFKPPVTTTYPLEPAEYPERSRGHIEIEIDQCIGCGLCVRACPCSTLSVDKLKGTWTIDRFDCIVCGYCVEKCPKNCLYVKQGYQEPGADKSPFTYTKSPEQLAKEEEQRKAIAAKAAAAKKAKEEAEKKKAEEAAKADSADKPVEAKPVETKPAE